MRLRHRLHYRTLLKTYFKFITKFITLIRPTFMQFSNFRHTVTLKGLPFEKLSLIFISDLPRTSILRLDMPPIFEK